MRYQLPLPIPLVGAEYQGVADTQSSVLISASVTTPLIWNIDAMYRGMKGPRHYSSVMNIIELDDFIQEFDTWCDMQFLRNPTLFTTLLA